MRSLHCCVVLAGFLTGCGCNDIGCGHGVEIAAPAEVERVELRSPLGPVVSCAPEETAPRCEIKTLADGSKRFVFLNMIPTATVGIEARGPNFVLLFDGDVSLRIEQTDLGPNACDQGDCARGDGELVL